MVLTEIKIYKVEYKQNKDTYISDFHEYYKDEKIADEVINLPSDYYHKTKQSYTYWTNEKGEIYNLVKNPFLLKDEEYLKNKEIKNSIILKLTEEELKYLNI